MDCDEYLSPPLPDVPDVPEVPEVPDVPFADPDTKYNVLGSTVPAANKAPYDDESIVTT